MSISKDSDVSTFSCGHADLDEFLIEDSMEYQQERLSVTRLAYIDSEIAGFFTLVTDCIDAQQVDPRNGKRGYPYRKSAPLSPDLIGDIRSIPIKGTRGSDRQPGNSRTVRNYIREKMRRA